MNNNEVRELLNPIINAVVKDTSDELSALKSKGRFSAVDVVKYNALDHYFHKLDELFTVIDKTFPYEVKCQEDSCKVALLEAENAEQLESVEPHPYPCKLKSCPVHSKNKKYEYGELV